MKLPQFVQPPYMGSCEVLGSSFMNGKIGVGRAFPSVSIHSVWIRLVTVQYDFNVEGIVKKAPMIPSFIEQGME